MHRPKMGRLGDCRRAPRAVRPIIAQHTPAALLARVETARDLPHLFHLRVAPWAVAHEGHEVFPIATRIAAARHITAVGVVSLRDILEAGSIAPRAVSPVELGAAVTTWACRRKRGLITQHFAAHATPGAGRHEF